MPNAEQTEAVPARTLAVLKDAFVVIYQYGQESGERPLEVQRALRALRDEIRRAESQ